MCLDNTRCPSELIRVVDGEFKQDRLVLVVHCASQARRVGNFGDPTVNVGASRPPVNLNPALSESPM